MYVHTNIQTYRQEENKNTPARSGEHKSHYSYIISLQDIVLLTCMNTHIINVSPIYYIKHLHNIKTFSQKIVMTYNTFQNCHSQFDFLSQIVFLKVLSTTSSSQGLSRRKSYCFNPRLILDKYEYSFPQYTHSPYV